MTTNKNRIAIAPTYTIKKRILKNSTPNNNIKIEALAKATTKKNTECIGFFALTTKKPDIKAPDPKIQNKASDINIDFLECLRGVEPPHLPSEVECTAIMLQTSFSWPPYSPVVIVVVSADDDRDSGRWWEAGLGSLT